MSKDQTWEAYSNGDLEGMDEIPTSKMDVLEDYSRNPLFSKASLTTLSATLLLLTYLHIHGTFSMLVNKLFMLLHLSILLEINSFLKNEYVTSKILK